MSTSGGLASSVSAESILEHYWPGGVPVDPAAIARAMGVQVHGVYDVPWSGHYCPHEEEHPVIYVNATEAEVRRRFTTAHELGHHALGHGERDRDYPSAFSASVYDPVEAAANRFAAQLLMPRSDVDFFIRKRGLRKISELAKTFRVSQKAMEFRLKALGWLNG